MKQAPVKEVPLTILINLNNGISRGPDDRVKIESQCSVKKRPILLFHFVLCLYIYMYIVCQHFHRVEILKMFFCWIITKCVSLVLSSASVCEPQHRYYNLRYVRQTRLQTKTVILICGKLNYLSFNSCYVSCYLDRSYCIVYVKFMSNLPHIHVYIGEIIVYAFNVLVSLSLNFHANH